MESRIVAIPFRAAAISVGLVCASSVSAAVYDRAWTTIQVNSGGVSLGSYEGGYLLANDWLRHPSTPASQVLRPRLRKRIQVGASAGAINALAGADDFFRVSRDSVLSPSNPYYLWAGIGIGELTERGAAGSDGKSLFTREQIRGNARRVVRRILDTTGKVDDTIFFGFALTRAIPREIPVTEADASVKTQSQQLEVAIYLAKIRGDWELGEMDLGSTPMDDTNRIYRPDRGYPRTGNLLPVTRDPARIENILTDLVMASSAFPFAFSILRLESMRPEVVPVFSDGGIFSNQPFQIGWKIARKRYAAVLSLRSDSIAGSARRNVERLLTVPAEPLSDSLIPHGQVLVDKTELDRLMDQLRILNAVTGDSLSDSIRTIFLDPGNFGPLCRAAQAPDTGQPGSIWLSMIAPVMNSAHSQELARFVQTDRTWSKFQKWAEVNHSRLPQLGASNAAFTGFMARSLREFDMALGMADACADEDPTLSLCDALLAADFRINDADSGQTAHRVAGYLSAVIPYLRLQSLGRSADVDWKSLRRQESSISRGNTPQIPVSDSVLGRYLLHLAVQSVDTSDLSLSYPLLMGELGSPSSLVPTEVRDTLRRQILSSAERIEDATIEYTQRNKSIALRNAKWADKAGKWLYFNAIGHMATSAMPPYLEQVHSRLPQIGFRIATSQNPEVFADVFTQRLGTRLEASLPDIDHLRHPTSDMSVVEFLNFLPMPGLLRVNTGAGIGFPKATGISRPRLKFEGEVALFDFVDLGANWTAGVPDPNAHFYAGVSFFLP